jgi:hypothetical protein
VNTIVTDTGGEDRIASIRRLHDRCATLRIGFEAGASLLEHVRCKRIKTQGQGFARDWPYCLDRLKDDLWLPLGRSYKPLFEADQERFYTYGDYAHLAWRFRGDPATAALLDGVWTRVHRDGRGASRLMLYDDNPASRKDYLVRLARIVGLTDDPIKNAMMLMSAGGSAGGHDPSPLSSRRKGETLRWHECSRRSVW